MRSSWATYQKLREVKHFHLVKLYKKHLRRTPENCLYNKKYALYDSNGKPFQIGLCLIHQDAQTEPINITLASLCQEQKDCQRCNAFVFRHTKETIKDLLEKDLSDRKIRERNYPDICALEWVLERDGQKIPFSGWIKGLYYFIKKLFKKWPSIGDLE